MVRAGIMGGLLRELYARLEVLFAIPHYCPTKELAWVRTNATLDGMVADWG